jgi:hypothetical protein
MEAPRGAATIIYSTAEQELNLQFPRELAELLPNRIALLLKCARALVAK